MQQTRTVKTLFALLVSMTIGTFALVLLQTEPISVPSFLSGSAVENPADFSKLINDTAVPIKPESWNTIIYHSDPNKKNVEENFHFTFTISQGLVEVQATDLWKAQLSGNHTNSPDLDCSKGIGIFINVPENDQSSAEIDEVRSKFCNTLQHICRINPVNTYARDQLR